MATLNSQAFESHPPGIDVQPGGTSVFHSSTTSSLQLIQPTSKIVTVKLEDGNFLTWKHQVLIAIRGYGLEDFIPGASDIPSQLLTNESDIRTNNPNFIAYQRQDRLLTSWLLSSISSDILPHFVVHTAQDVWNVVNQLFAAQCTARFMNYKLQLQT